MIGNLPSRPFGSGAIDGLVEFCGHPVVAALFGLVSAVIILRKSPARGDDDFWAQLTGWIEKAVTKVAPVLLVAALAAALSQVIKAGPLLECIGDAFASNHTSTRFLVLFSCFALAALFKSIQGSSLVAAVLASGVMASFPQTVTLNPALAVAAVGAGALAVSHVNDPFYWILQKGLGWSTREMTRAWTVATAIEGAAGFAAVCIMALFVR
jgi:GntP family gluconate:H+ symporter